MKNNKILSAVTAFVCALTCFVPAHTMAYEAEDIEVKEETAVSENYTETTILQTDLYDEDEAVTTAPEQAAVTVPTVTTIPLYERVTLPVTTAFIAGVDINNVRPASADDIVIEPGSTAEMNLSISDTMDSFDTCSGSMKLPEGISCEKITYGDDGIADFKVSGSTVTFEMPESTVTVTFSADEDMSDGEYQISFGYITRTYSRPSGDIYIAGGYRYEVSGGAVKVASPAVTTSVPVTTVTSTTETTRTTTTSREIYTVTSLTQFPPTPVSAVAYTTVIGYADNVAVPAGEYVKMKFSIPFFNESYYKEYGVRFRLPSSILCTDIVNSADNSEIKFSVKPDFNYNWRIYNFDMTSDEVVLTLFVANSFTPGTYQLDLKFSISDGSYIDCYKYELSGGTIEVTESRSPSGTRISYYTPETQPVSTTIIPVTTTTETQNTAESVTYVPSTDIIRKAYADDVVLSSGVSAKMKLSVPDREESDGSCNVSVNLPYGVYCNNIINSKDRKYIPFHMSISREETLVSFSISSDTVVMTLSIGGEISPGTYQAIFKADGSYMIPYESCSYLTGNYEYDFSGGAIEIADSGTSSVTTAPSVTQPEKTETQQVTTTVIPVTQLEKTEPLPGAISVLPVTQPENTETQPVTTTIIPVTTVPETEETTQTTTTSIEIVTSIYIVTSLPPGQCQWIPGAEIERKVYVDDVTLNIGETAEMKLSVPDRETIDDDYYITAYLPAGVYCENIIDCETELSIKFSMKTDEENNSVSFSMPSDEIIMTISAEDGSVPGTYSTRFSSSARYSNSSGDYYHIFGNISLNFSGGTIEITDQESPAVTTTVIPVTQPENTETQPVTTTIIPVTTVPETQETEPETRLKGDISGNGEIDIYDAVEIAKEILGMRTFTEEEKKIADINGDGMVNLYDAIEIAGMFIYSESKK